MRQNESFKVGACCLRKGYPRFVCLWTSFVWIMKFCLLTDLYEMNLKGISSSSFDNVCALLYACTYCGYFRTFIFVHFDWVKLYDSKNLAGTIFYLWNGVFWGLNECDLRRIASLQFVYALIVMTFIMHSFARLKGNMKLNL